MGFTHDVIVIGAGAGGLTAAGGCALFGQHERWTPAGPYQGWLCGPWMRLQDLRIGREKRWSPGRP